MPATVTRRAQNLRRQEPNALSHSLSRFPTTPSPSPPRGLAQSARHLTQSARPERLMWPDVAKGISIVGVVVLHMSLAVPGAQETWLYALNTWIDPLRMPLFFLVSGFFSRKVLTMSLLDLLTRRLWFFVVPYLVWVSVELWTKKLEYHWVFGNPPLKFVDLVYNLALGHNMGWFLHALVLFNLVLFAARRLPPWAVIAVSFSPLLFLPLHDQFYFVGKALMYLPCFIIGVYFRSLIVRFTQLVDSTIDNLRLTPRSVAVFAVVIGLYAGGYSLRQFWENHPGDIEVVWLLPGADVIGRPELLLLLRLVEQLAEVPMALAGAVLISRIPGIAGVFAFIGRHTLPIYLAHPIALTVGFGYVAFFAELQVGLEGTWPWENTWFWIPACLVLSAVASIALWALGRVPVLGWVFTPPQIVGWLSQRLPDRAAQLRPDARPAREPLVDFRGGRDDTAPRAPFGHR